jgi:transposase
MGDTPSTCLTTFRSAIARGAFRQNVRPFDDNGRNHLSKADAVTIAAIEAGVPVLAEVRRPVDRFQTMIRRKIVAEFDPWIADADASRIASLASGITKDQRAIKSAITQPWSNGQTESQITKLKLVKRQMYGRGKLDLLQALLLGAA